MMFERDLSCVTRQTVCFTLQSQTLTYDAAQEVEVAPWLRQNSLQVR